MKEPCYIPGVAPPPLRRRVVEFVPQPAPKRHTLEDHPMDDYPYMQWANNDTPIPYGG